MVELFLNLLANLVKFGEVREKNREKYIESYVDPVYEHAEAIYQDYAKLLLELQRKLAKARKVAPLLRFLEERRMENFTVRTKTRALLRKRMEKHFATRFERGIWGLMMGSVSLFDYGYTDFGPLNDIPSDHTLLDVMERLSQAGQPDIDPNARKMALV